MAWSQAVVRTPVECGGGEVQRHARYGAVRRAGLITFGWLDARGAARAAGAPAHLLPDTQLWPPCRQFSGSVPRSCRSRTSDGVTLHGWWIEGRGDRALIWYHGNAGNIGDRLHNARWFVDRLGVDVVLVDYRGYGRSQGTPDEEPASTSTAWPSTTRWRADRCGRRTSSSSAGRWGARSRSRRRSGVPPGPSCSNRCSARCRRWPASTTGSSRAL